VPEEAHGTPARASEGRGGGHLGPAGRVAGRCDRRFEAVRRELEANFADRGETGGGICVMLGGTVVADLWGGCADAAGRRRWQQDTLVNVFSVGKGLIAACTARLIGQHALDADAPVARYWPEFGAAGKDLITVRMLLSHQAGLPALRARMPERAVFDWTAMTTALAAEPPWWPPGSAHGYHVNTFGFLAGEVIRRVTGRTIGALLREEVAEPLGADVHIGLPSLAQHRVAEFLWPGEWPDGRVQAGLSDDRLMRHHAYANPAGLSGFGVINTAAWRASEIPSANAHATAAGVARVYAALAAGGAIDGVRVVDTAALAAATTEQVYGEDLVLQRPSRFGLGFQLTHPERSFGPGRRAFGHFGAGGSVGFCDPDAGIAVGYVTSQMGPRWQNPRNRALIDAVYASL
jgi:CubicO group peptidase (beta-lactamase class C family)